uniref:C-type lectin domain-containing protein n=1 Tax=Scleropages formosus TaxID=113540 RepID=A0A8C9V7M3_SCLFO
VCVCVCVWLLPGALNSSLTQAQVCPERWNSFKFSCYYISHEKKNWDDSRQYCKERGADLVIINSKEEQAFIDHFQSPFWIGLSDKEREGTWKWVDGTIMPQYEGTWCFGQPDNFEQDEDCVQTRLTELDPSMRWNDLSCDSALQWVCEKQSGS